MRGPDIEQNEFDQSGQEPSVYVASSVRPHRRVALGVLGLRVAALAALLLAVLAARSLGYLVVTYVAAGALAEALLGEARREEAFQFGAGLILFAALAGHGSAAPLVAAGILGVRLVQERRRAILSGSGAVYVLAAAAAWATGSVIPSLQVPILPPSVWTLPNAIAIATAFLVVDIAGTTLLLALDSPPVARLRLAQHLPRLVVHFAWFSLIIWIIYVACAVIFGSRGVPVVLATLILTGFAAGRLARRRQLAYQQLVVLTRAAEEKDRETAGHMRRVGLYSQVIAGELGLSARAVERIGLAAQLHDLGKVGVPEILLQYSGQLTPEMRCELEQHATLGEQLLLAFSSLPEAALIAGGHHERWDGAGYPHGRAGTGIPIEARIAAVADSWDAMTSDRPYRAALTAEAALAELGRGSGRQFDPQVVAAFARALEQRVRRWSLLNPWDTTPLIS